ncbi:MAG: hypothetical protein ACYTEP_04410 [Planctomycetota bacterium]|jgi:hypothetical protein
MKLIANLLFIGGFCLATVGGAGFADPLEDMALVLFIAGMVVCLIGGLMVRKITHAEAHERASAGLSEEGMLAGMQDLAQGVDRLCDDAADLDGKALCARADELLKGGYFDLGSHNEDYMRVLGNATYTRYWDGFAVSERLLSRAWSMAADGALEEARAELPGVRSNLARALQA